MTFEKPKVTIDLEEYNFLNNKIEELQQELKKDVDKVKIERLERISGTVLSFINNKDNNSFKNLMQSIENEFKIKTSFIVDNTSKLNCRLLI